MADDVFALWDGIDDVCALWNCEGSWPREAATERGIKLDDWAPAKHGDVERSVVAIRRALAPLLNAAAPSVELLAAARETAAHSGGVLLPAHILHVVRDEVGCELRRGRRARGG